MWAGVVPQHPAHGPFLPMGMVARWRRTTRNGGSFRRGHERSGYGWGGNQSRPKGGMHPRTPTLPSMESGAQSVSSQPGRGPIDGWGRSTRPVGRVTAVGGEVEPNISRRVDSTAPQVERKRGPPTRLMSPVASASCTMAASSSGPVGDAPAIVGVCKAIDVGPIRRPRPPPRGGLPNTPTPQIHSLDDNEVMVDGACS